MSEFPRTDKWIERYNLRRGTGLEAFPMDLESELQAKDAIIADMGKRFDKLGSELTDAKADLSRAIENMDGPSARLLDEVARLKAENEWHPASQRPELHRHIMTIDSMGQMTINFWYPTDDCYWSERDGDEDSKVTHWRELPAAPEVKP